MTRILVLLMSYALGNASFAACTNCNLDDTVINQDVSRVIQHKQVENPRYQPVATSPRTIVFIPKTEKYVVTIKDGQLVEIK